MAAPLDAPWSNNTLTDAVLGEVTVGKGTSYPSTWEVGRMFLRTDLNQIYYNSGTEGTPVWTLLGGSGSEESTETGSGTTDVTASGTLNLGDELTMPTTFNEYVFTAVGWHNGTAVSASTAAGVCIIDQYPPVDRGIFMVAQCPLTANSGTSAEQKVNVEYSLTVKGGSKVHGYVNCSTTSQKYEGQTISSANERVTSTVPSNIHPVFYDPAAWTTNTQEPKITLYYKGVG